ncbi:RNA polymerase sigma factor [Flavihumibacter sp. UBA7668]|uniref:RNA polymerase sigma factor n=1 Tax=Flavihumibacter sp. UBA7668 TaxID=1946542 RepID=UPI0025C625D2|nr:RNA polymerase sigma factor [Flavihumibacter sp. UBA7668]
MDITAPTDNLLKQLVEGCVSLKRQSQKSFYEHFYGYAYAVCHRYISREEEVLEVVNDGFVKIFREMERFQLRYDSYEASLKAWIRRIFINTAIDHLRKKQLSLVAIPTETEEYSHLPVVEPTGLSSIAHKELLAMIRRLSPAYGLVFNLYVIDGYNHEEIASMLKISVGSSKSNLSKARANLQKMLAEELNRNQKNERERIRL